MPFAYSMPVHMSKSLLSIVVVLPWIAITAYIVFHSFDKAITMPISTEYSLKVIL